MAEVTDTPVLRDFNKAPEVLQRAAAHLALRAARDIGADVRVIEMTDDELLHLAVGVIQAIREPSEAMIANGDDLTADEAPDDAAVRQWRSWIDVLLAPDQP